MRQVEIVVDQTLSLHCLEERSGYEFNVVAWPVQHQHPFSFLDESKMLDQLFSDCPI